MAGDAKAQACALLDTLAFPGLGDPLSSDRALPSRPKQSRRAQDEHIGQTTKRVGKRYRQAGETACADGRVQVEVLCSQCRRDTESKRQTSLGQWLVPQSPVVAASSLTETSTSSKSCTQRDPDGQSRVELVDLTIEESQTTDPTVCQRCRRSLVVSHMSVRQTSRRTTTGCVFSSRLKQYKRQAVETCAAWRLSDSEALALMRAPCCLCGAQAAPEAGRPNGITRLRADSSVHGMGPYISGNVATACAICNSMKGTHTVAAMIDICRSIATYRGLGCFGLFPERFVNNISRRSRSCYLGDTARKPGGTVASKTHSLSNADFNRIVAQPCHYCGKRSDPPQHYNGLDRLDNALRVYTIENSVSCCGTCNMAKGKLSEEFFLEQCRTIAARFTAAGVAAMDAPRAEAGNALLEALTEDEQEDENQDAVAVGGQELAQCGAGGDTPLFIEGH
mmetsp:Transcript_133769/g.286081  ORF Transcript_133769/g.286081 Transcript_133769/m.286081 type:complete len:450 (-) Transcript_133769:278-1627(-)